jgi:hypothetical protein
MPINESLTDEQFRRYQYARDRGHLTFVQKADKCDKFLVGDQWKQEDLNALELAQRPAMTINKLLPVVGNVLGAQIQNRTEVLFRPTAGAPAAVAEALSKVWMQISQNNQLSWLRSDVFFDGIVRSRGFYDVRMDYSDSVFGEVKISPLNSKNVIIDPDAEEYDPDSWNDVFTTRWMCPDDIGVLYNEADAKELRTTASTGITRFGNDSLDHFRDTFAGSFQNSLYMRTNGIPLETTRNIRVLDRQYRKLDKQLHFVDTVTGDMRPVPRDWDRDRIAMFLQQMGGQLATTKKLVKRIRWTVTADHFVLHDDWSPYKHFTVVPYFPYFRYGRTVGIVENLIGSQEILNKVSSQELHIVNTTANSGYIVEEDSLVNMTTEELELNGAQTGVVIEYKKGAQPPVKIQPNQPPSGLDRISMKAEEHIKTISGISDSMMGFDRADVAAKAIAYKQQAGSISLSKVLDSLERTDWLLARNVLDLVQEFYSNERLINITHEDFTNEQEEVAVNQADPVTGAITNDLTIGEYDIVITSSPYRASLEDSQFEQAKALREIGIAIPDSVLIENSRLLRRSEIVKEMQAAANSPQAQKQAELQMRGAEAEVATKEVGVEKEKATVELQRAKAVQAVQPDGEDPQVEKQRADQEMALERYKVEQQMALEKYKADENIKLEKQKLEFEMELKREEATRQAALQRVQALRTEASQTTPT